MCVDWNAQPMDDGELPRIEPHCRDLREAATALTSLMAERDGLREALNNSHQLAATARDRRSTAAAPAPADIQAIVEATRPIANPAANNALSLDTNKGDGIC